MTRTFEIKPAVRERVPLLIGLIGASGSGKTYSALRLAGGIQRIAPGPIHFIDTEAKRGLHYADRFQFEHLVLTPPFSPLDYLAAIEQCVAKGAKTIIVDSFTHEHTGAGGVLEMHEQELERLSKGNASRREAMNFPAWAKPKAQRTKLLDRMLQLSCNYILCFRAKEKIKLIAKKDRVEGEDPVKPLGFMPVGGEEYVYEMTLNCLLYPGSRGVPTWGSEELGERMIAKLPEQFRALFSEDGTGGRTLSEDVGEELAKWAAGVSLTDSPFGKLSAAIADAKTIEELDAVNTQIAEIPKTKSVPAPQYKILQRAHAARLKALKDADPEPDSGPQERVTEDGEVLEPGATG